MIVGIVVDAGRAVEGQAVRFGPSGGFDVEVVQHLEVVGDESAGADDHPGDVGVRAELVDHLEDVGADPRLGCAACRLPGDLPVVTLGDADRRGDRFRGGPQFVRIRVTGGDDPLRERVGGEEHPDRPPVRSRMASTRAARSSARNETNAGSTAQLSMPITCVDPPASTAPWRVRSRY